MIACQCPHGLVPHCYCGGAIVKKTVAISCQCPHGLVPHCYEHFIKMIMEAVEKVSMPSRASTSLLPPQLFLESVGKLSVSMPSRASTSLLQDYEFNGKLQQIRGVNALTG